MRIGERLADIFTKALVGSKVDYICNKLRMINIYGPAWGECCELYELAILEDRQL